MGVPFIGPEMAALLVRNGEDDAPAGAEVLVWEVDVTEVALVDETDASWPVLLGDVPFAPPKEP